MSNLENMNSMKLSVLPATPERWGDLETLFGKRGACGGCWCIYWRMVRKEFEQGLGETNRLKLKELVDTGPMPGLLGYLEGRPVGWVSLGPRESFPTLNRSRILKPVDDQLVWSVVCFFVVRQQRKKGLTVQLLDGAVQYAGQQGAKIVEGYPVEPRQDSYPAVYLYTGAVSTFRAVGFEEVARRSETRPVMRKYLFRRQDGLD
jgi:GNAT superfamily N-acetyltransferase